MCTSQDSNSFHYTTRGWGWGEMEIKSFVANKCVGHSEKSRAPKVGHHFGRSAARQHPDRPAAGAFAGAFSAGHRAPSRESGGVCRQWSVDHGQNCRDESATDLSRSPAVRFPAQIARRGHLLPFRGPRQIHRSATHGTHHPQRARRGCSHPARLLCVSSVITLHVLLNKSPLGGG